MVNYREEAPTIVRDFLRYEKTNHNLRDKTLQEYFLDLRVFLRFLKQDRNIAGADTPFEEIPIKDIDIEFIRGITKQDIQSYIDYLRSDRKVKLSGNRFAYGLSATSASRKIACLRSFFSYLCDVVELLEKNPISGTKVSAKNKPLPSYLTEDEGNRLLSSIDGSFAERDYCIILIFLCCGLRVSEIVSINISDIHIESDSMSAFLTITGKGGKQRQVYLPANCIKAINDYLYVRDEAHAADDAKDALFLSRKHNRISVRAVQEMVTKSTVEAGIRKVSPHKLRHTAATMMMNNGVDIRTLQELLGHSSINTTQIYTHLSNQNIAAAIEFGNPMARFGQDEAAQHKLDALTERVAESNSNSDFENILNQDTSGGMKPV